MSTVTRALDDYRVLRTQAFAWRDEAPAAVKVALALAMAGATGIMAQVVIPLPFTPVPVTGQVFAVLLAGVLLGRGYGGLSQVFYIGMGAAGVRWFAGLSGGMGVLTGVTGGYLVGMVMAAELIGFATDRFGAMRSFWPLLGLMMFGVAVIYACGVLQLMLVLRVGLADAVVLGAVPFLPLDVAKAVLAASVGAALLPKRTDDEAELADGRA